MQIIDLRRIKPPDEIGLLKKAALFPLVAPLSGAYAIAARAWRRTPSHATDPGVPVISVGSISVGGTGKTPLAIEVARRFAEEGVKVCILSRGYRRRGRRSPLAVSDGHRMLASVEEAGDEPYMMARRLPGVGVMVGKNRVRAALAARDLFAPGLFVLDDGFQYRRIAKSAEIVCLDPASLRPGAAALPLGSLREGFSSIKAGHIVVIMLGPGQSGPRPEDLERLRPGPVFYASRSPLTFADASGKTVGAGVLDGDAFAIVSGIARPGAFEASCVAAGVNAVVSIRFEDHHWYMSKDTDMIRSVMEKSGSSRLVTTEKDIHKLPDQLKEVAVVAQADLGIDQAEPFWNVLDGAVRG
jgi:tetraacyldisaccharide 4'-kinase